MAKLRPLLQRALDTLDRDVDGAFGGTFSRNIDILGAALDVDPAEGRLPVVMQLPESAPRRGETWPEFKDRSRARLGAVNEALTGGEGTPLFLANAIAARMEPRQLARLADSPAVSTIELDRLVNVVDMDDAVVDAGLRPFLHRHGPHQGSGVRVALLDSGIDLAHPSLTVAASVTTCGEPVSLPGSHGTHCAGSLASRDALYPGMAPGVDLLNIKVLRQNGTGTSTFITQGIDEALDLNADILSMSLGFNHLPEWSRGGHGWTCPDGRCELCTAVDNAVFFGATVIVAAGNEHNKAEALRAMGEGAAFDTELGCPGQSRSALTVGALTKTSFLAADFTSHGPTAYGDSKPDLAGPGVNITSTIPVPLDGAGQPTPDPLRSQLFGRKSGTSMATPIVAGTAALVMEQRRALGLPVEPADMRAVLLGEAVTAVGLPANVAGHGRIDLSIF